MSDLTGHHVPIDYHVALNRDPWRTALWRRALRRTLTADQTALDVGAGIGLLSVLAAQAGARVTAVESAWVADIAEQVVARAGCQDRVQVVRADLATLTPQPVDVIFADFVGRMLPDATMLRALRAAAAWAGPTTRYLPSRVRLVIAPVADVPFAALDRLRTPLFGVDLAAALPAAWSTAWAVHLEPSAVLCPPQAFASLDPSALLEHVQADLQFTVPRAARLRGFIGWFEADLAPGVTLDTAPGYRTFWGQTLWPVPAHPVAPGDALHLRWRGTSLPDGVGFRWHARTVRGGDTLSDHRGDTRDRVVASSPPVADPARDGAKHLAAGQPDLAAPELLASLDDGPERASLGELVLALVQRGEHGAATQALELYEAHFGDHPTARRATTPPDRTDPSDQADAAGPDAPPDTGSSPPPSSTSPR